MSTTRRSFLAGAAALAAAPAFAKTSMGDATSPVYRMKLGDFEIVAFSDGYLDAPVKIFSHIDPAEADRLLAKDFRPTGGTVRFDVNAFVVNTGDKLVLIDSGTVVGFAPTIAKFPERLAAAGYKADDFDAVAMTHLHADHVGGLLTADGQARFSKAEFIVNAAEMKFWWDDGIMSRAGKDAQGFFQAARASSKPYEKATRTFDKDGEVVKGISAVALPGHTPGHTGYLISSGKESLLIWGDIVHSPTLQFAHPEAGVAFDVDPDQAASTRKKIFEQVVADKTMVAGMHLNFPAFSRVEAEGAGYRSVPDHWRL